MRKKFRHIVLDGDPRIINNRGLKDLTVLKTVNNSRLSNDVQWRVISNKEIAKIAYSLIVVNNKDTKIKLPNLYRVIRQSKHLLIINNVLFERWPKGWWATQVV